VIGAALMNENHEVLIITEKGYGKRTKVKEYPVKGRGGKGIKTANITAKNGPLAGLTTVSGEEDIMVITDKGVLIRFNVATVSQTGRATLGVRLMKMENNAKVVTMATVEPEVEEELATAEETAVQDVPVVEETTEDTTDTQE